MHQALAYVSPMPDSSGRVLTYKNCYCNIIQITDGCVGNCVVKSTFRRQLSQITLPDSLRKKHASLPAMQFVTNWRYRRQPCLRSLGTISQCVRIPSLTRVHALHGSESALRRAAWQSSRSTSTNFCHAQNTSHMEALLMLIQKQISAQRALLMSGPPKCYPITLSKKDSHFLAVLKHQLSSSCDPTQIL